MKDLLMRVMAWVLVVGGCANTMRGVGKDLNKAGEEIEDELD